MYPLRLHVDAYFKHAQPQIKRSWVRCEGGLGPAGLCGQRLGRRTVTACFIASWWTPAKTGEEAGLGAGGGVIKGRQKASIWATGREGAREIGNTPVCVGVCGSQVTFLQTCCICSSHTTTQTHSTRTHRSKQDSRSSNIFNQVLGPLIQTKKIQLIQMCRLQTWDLTVQMRLNLSLITGHVDTKCNNCFNRVETAVTLVTWNRLRVH